jgi:hypothetical protein
MFFSFIHSSRHHHHFVTMRTPKGPSQPNINSGTPNPRPSTVTHCATNPSQDQQNTSAHHHHHFVTMWTPKGPSQPNINSGTPIPRPSIVAHCATNPSQDQQNTCRHTRLQQKHAACTRHKATRARPTSRTCTGFQPSVASMADIADAHMEGKMQLTNANGYNPTRLQPNLRDCTWNLRAFRAHSSISS